MMGQAPWQKLLGVVGWGLNVAVLAFDATLPSAMHHFTAEFGMGSAGDAVEILCVFFLLNVYLNLGGT